MNEYIMNTYYMDISLILHALKNTSSKKRTSHSMNRDIWEKTHIVDNYFVGVTNRIINSVTHGYKSR